MTNGEPGQSFDTVNAEVVGVFHPAADLPAPGDALKEDTPLGYVEALKLKSPVLSGPPCTFVAQVVEDGQAVEFGQTLFVVDRKKPSEDAAPESIEIPEPPRL
jgi:biotin carboxyl carrier protein